MLIVPSTGRVILDVDDQLPFVWIKSAVMHDSATAVKMRDSTAVPVTRQMTERVVWIGAEAEQQWLANLVTHWIICNHQLSFPANFYNRGVLSSSEF